MGPKKGKGSKLARMSDEERARYLQHRAAIEEEARRRKEQLIETFMKNKLKKEEAFSRLNVAKINQEWRQTLRVYKCSELKQDLDALQHWFNHAIQKKTELIEYLLEDLNQAEIQYARIYQCHMETIDRLLEIYNNRIRTMQKSFEDEREHVFSSARLEANEMFRDATAHQEHLQAIIFRINQTSEEKLGKVSEFHNMRVDELRNHMLTELENVVNSKECRMETLWNSYEKVLQYHSSQTEDRRREYLNLRQADAENCHHIFQYHQQISSLNTALSGLKTKLGANNTNGNEHLIEKKSDLNNSLELFHLLRCKLKNERNLDTTKLRRMTNCAENATKGLKRTLGKGQQILQLYVLCRKYESSSEKICHGLDRPISDVQPKSCPAFDEPLSAEVYIRFRKLEGFWDRFNQVFIEKEALSLHNQALGTEQKQLKYILKQYFKEFAEKQVLLKVPLLQRPLSTTHVNKKGIMLKGERVQTCCGKIDSCTERSHTSYLHMLTIELTKQ